MTVDNVKKVIFRLESIDPFDEFAYEKAFLAYMTIKHLPVFVFNVASGMEVCRARTSFTNDLYGKISDIALLELLHLTRGFFSSDPVNKLSLDNISPRVLPYGSI